MAKKGMFLDSSRRHLASLHSPNLTWNCMLFLWSPNMNLWYGLKWMLFPRKSCNELFVYKITPRLTWNPMQAQTEPKLQPETANMEFEQVITKRSETLKGDLKFNLEPKWFLRRGSCKFHVSDFRATLFFTSYCAHVLITIQVPGLWWGKNWNQNTSKKKSRLLM